MRSYQFTDAEANKTGVRYYRLKIVDNNGHISYSAIRPVVFSNEIKWQVYPNPTTGKFTFSYQANAGEMIYIKIYDVSGKLIQQQQSTATGFVQNKDLQLSVSGLYLMEVKAGETKQSFRIVRQ